MNRTLIAVLATCVAFGASLAHAQVTATGTGGAGGTGGSATGGMATGGSSTNTNSTTGGTSSATGGAANIGSATSNYQGAEVSVNYITPAGAAGVNGLAPGVDPSNNHVVSDNNVHYSGTTRIKNTPDVNIGGPASGPCNGMSGGVGVGVPGLAVGANLATVDKGCEAREAARVAAMLGRMDVANAILENMDVVVAALKAKADRDARAALATNELAAQARRADTANASIAQAVRDRDEADAQARRSARDRESEAMRAQQQAGTEALARQATMAKVNDTLSFTGKLTQGEEKTPQQVMAEEAIAKQEAQRRDVEQKQAAERAAADEAARQARQRASEEATRQAAAEKAAEQLAAEKAAAEKLAAEKAAADRLAADRKREQQKLVEPRDAGKNADPRRPPEPMQVVGQPADTNRPRPVLFDALLIAARPDEAMAKALQRTSLPVVEPARGQAVARDATPDAAKDAAVRSALGLDR